MSSSPQTSGRYHYNARVYNHIFSSRPTTAEITSALGDEPAKDLEPLAACAPQDATALTRRQDAQRDSMPHGSDIKYKPEPDEEDLQAEIQKRAARLQRRRRRNQHRKRLLASKVEAHALANADGSDSSSTSSSSSSSSSWYINAPNFKW